MRLRIFAVFCAVVACVLAGHTALGLDMSVLPLKVRSFEGALFDEAVEQVARGNLELARELLAQAVKDAPKFYRIHALLGDVEFALGDFASALGRYEAALKLTDDPAASKRISRKAAAMRRYVAAKAAHSLPDDQLAPQQTYLMSLNVPAAWESVPSSAKTAVVAVIDDGVSVNHPDLVGHIWTNSKEIPGNGIDDDKNGYVDDFNGWNFADDDAQALLPAGSHGTMVAGVIGAVRNNKIGVAGVAQDVKIMPLRVFPHDGEASPEWVIAAIGYAVDNGADVINLSLGGTQFAYSADSDFILREAARMGVMVVIAAGNGDVLSGQSEGVDTTVNKLSPLCNGAGLDAVVGVGASDATGGRARWSNYGTCVRYFVPGENVPSTSVSAFNFSGKQYQLASGTSFSAPMVTGIIALGINKYGRQAPVDVRAALDAAYVADGFGEKALDAKKYLDALGNQVSLAAERARVAARTAALSPVESSIADRFAATYAARAKATGTSPATYAAALRKLAARADVHARVRALAAAIADRLP